VAADDEQQQPEEPGFEIIIEPHQLAGVWANWAQVSHSEHEFTLDFVRMDYSQGTPPRRGIVLARVGLSPLFVLQLIDALNRNWASYAEKAMPKEVRGGGSDGDEGSGAQPGDAPSDA
jgi:Protein of unknown function (DUF3467)